MKNIISTFAIIIYCTQISAQQLTFSSSTPPQIWKASLATSSIPQNISSTLGNNKITGLFVDEKNGLIYSTVSEDDSGTGLHKIIKSDLSGLNEEILLADDFILNEIDSPVINPENPNFLYFVDRLSPYLNSHSIYELDLSDNSFDIVNGDGTVIESMVMHNETNTLYFIEWEGSRIGKIDLALQGQPMENIITEDLGYEFKKLAIDQSTKDLYFLLEAGPFPTNNFDQVRVLKNNATNSEPIFDGVPEETIASLAFDPTGKLYFNYSGYKDILSINTDGTSLDTLIRTTDFSAPNEVQPIEFISLSPFIINNNVNIGKKINGLSILPNPNQGSFSINLNQENVKGNFEIDIYNQVGKVLHQQEVNDQQIQLDLSLTPGVYFLKLTNPKSHSQSTTKFVVQ